MCQKRFYCSIFLACIITIFCSVQTKAQSFKGGVLLGVNGSQIDGDTHSGYDKSGLICGIYTYTALSEKNALQIEIEYIGKGARKKNTETDPTFYKSSLHYIEIPIFFKRQLKKKIIGEVGIGFGYLLKYSEEDEYGEIPLDKSAQFKPLEISTIVGIGYKISEQLTAKLRFSYSAIPVVDAPKLQIPQYVDRGAYNNSISIGLCYDFRQ